MGWPPSPPKPAQEAAWRVLCGLSDKKGPRGNSESVIMQKKPGELDTNPYLLAPSVDHQYLLHPLRGFLGCPIFADSRGGST